MNSQSARPWWQPGPFDYSTLELWLVRTGFACLFFWNTKWETAPYTTQPNPNGIARWVDLTWLGHHPPGMLLQGMTIAGLALYVLGFLPALGLLPAAFFGICIPTLINSQGEIQHSWQLVTLMGLAQLAVYALPEHGLSGILRPSRERHRQAVYAATVVIAAGYVVCGVVKLVNSDFQWIQKVPFLAVQILKSNWAAYYDSLQQPPQWLQDAARMIIDHPNVARLFFGTGLALEIFAFVILISRPWAFWFGLGLVSLHVGIMHVMNLTFIQHIFAVLIFLVVPNLSRALPRRSSHAAGQAALERPEGAGAGT